MPGGVDSAKTNTETRQHIEDMLSLLKRGGLKSVDKSVDKTIRERHEAIAFRVVGAVNRVVVEVGEPSDIRREARVGLGGRDARNSRGESRFVSR
jgi:hypothetical protein